MMASLYQSDTALPNHVALATEMYEKAAAQGHIYAAGRLHGITATKNGAVN
jgi:hypothetical protein